MQTQRMLFEGFRDRMRTYIFIIGAMFYFISLSSVNFGIYPEMLIAGVSAFAMGWSIGNK